MKSSCKKPESSRKYSMYLGVPLITPMVVQNYLGQDIKKKQAVIYLGWCSSAAAAAAAAVVVVVVYVEGRQCPLFVLLTFSSRILL